MGIHSVAATCLVSLILYAGPAAAIEQDTKLAVGSTLLGLGYVGQVPFLFLDRATMSPGLRDQPTWSFAVPVLGSAMALHGALGDDSCSQRKFSGECGFAKGGRIFAFSLQLGLQLVGAAFLAAGFLDGDETDFDSTASLQWTPLATGAVWSLQGRW